jgi:membrane protease YdiL (CAAX protease family)
MKPKLFVFTTREAYFLAAASMFIGLSLSLVLQGVSAGMGQQALIDRLVMLLGELLILLPPWLIFKKRGLNFAMVLPWQPVSPVTAIMALVLVAGAVGMTSVFEILMMPYFPVPEFLEQMLTGLEAGSFAETAVLVLTAVLVAPLVEEFIFRGLLQNSLFYRYGSLVPAMIIPTVIFALFHVAYLFYLPALLELLGLALLLAWLMAKTANLLIPVLVHGLFNLSAFADMFQVGGNQATTLSDLGIPWIVISGLLLFSGWLYFRKIPTVVLEEVYLIPPLQDEELRP